MVVCYILRKTGTLKTKRVKDKKDDFVFENGTYYLKKDRIYLRPKLIRGYVPFLFYIEGISEPISFTNIEKRKIQKLDAEGQPEYDKDNEPVMIEDTTVLISAKNIHDMTSKKMLSVLSTDQMSKLDKILIILLILILLTSIAGAL